MASRSAAVLKGHVSGRGAAGASQLGLVSEQCQCVPATSGGPLTELAGPDATAPQRRRHPTPDGIRSQGGGPRTERSRQGLRGERPPLGGSPIVTTHVMLHTVGPPPAVDNTCDISRGRTTTRRFIGCICSYFIVSLVFVTTSFLVRLAQPSATSYCQ